MSLPKPYYQDGAVTIYHARAEDILPHVEVDFVATDPPYGVGFEYASYEDSPERWRSEIKPLIEWMAGRNPLALCMSRRKQWEIPPALWSLAWLKPGSTRNSRVSGWACWEPVFLYGKGWSFPQDFLLLPDCVNHAEYAGDHGCPKPVKLFSWLIQGHKGTTVLDPFAGIGTTGRAAKDLGKKAVLVEMEERYCEIAARRMAQEVLPLTA